MTQTHYPAGYRTVTMNNKSLKEFNKLLLNHFESIGASIINLENQSASRIFYYQRNIISGSSGFKHHFLSFYPPSQYQAQRGLVNKELVILSGREVNILRDNKKETIGVFHANDVVSLTREH